MLNADLKILKSYKNQCESRSVPPSQFVKQQQKQRILERSSHIGTVSCLGYPSFNEVSMFGNVEQLLCPGWPSGRPSGWGQCCSLARQGWGEFKNYDRDKIYDRDRNYDKGKDYDSNRNHDKGKNNFKGKTITMVKPMTNAKTIQCRHGHCKCKNRDKKRHSKNNSERPVDALAVK